MEIGILNNTHVFVTCTTVFIAGIASPVSFRSRISSSKHMLQLKNSKEKKKCIKPSFFLLTCGWLCLGHEKQVFPKCAF